MNHLIRQRLLDRVWGADDLDAAAVFWVKLYEAAASQQGYSSQAVHACEIRLRGFPRHQTDALRRELEHCVKAEPAPEAMSGDAGFRAFHISQPDADTLTIGTDSWPSNHPLPHGCGLPQLTGPSFDGLCVEVRIQAGARVAAATRPVVHATLVLIGELFEGSLDLKALWRSCSTGFEDQLNWHAVWPDEERWLKAYDEFCADHTIPRELATTLFTSPKTDSFATFCMRMIHVPLGKPRGVGLLIRALAFAVALALPACAAFVLVQQPNRDTLPIYLLMLIVFASPIAWLAWQFFKNELWLLVQTYLQFHTGFSRLYAEPVTLIALPESEAEIGVDQPWARKYRAELEAAGFRRAGEMQCSTPLLGNHVFQVWFAPDGVTYLNLLYQTSTGDDPHTSHELWPCAESLLAITYFADGARVSSINGWSNSFRRKRTGPESQMRIFADVTDPVELVTLHRTEMEQFARLTGRTPLRHERLDDHIRRQNALQVEERRLYQDHPFTWGDAWRYYLQWPRRVYLP